MKRKANLYEINKASMAQIEPLDPIWFNKKCEHTAKEILKGKSQYWMLLCRERYDITIFNLLSNTPIIRYKIGSLVDLFLCPMSI